MSLPSKSFLLKTTSLLKQPIIVSGLLILILSINACDHDNDIEKSATDADDQSTLISTDIEDSLLNSYASVASNRSDICPKLVQKQVDSTAIQRTSEIMVNNSCDYFLYPQAGTSIGVALNNDQIEALLITPKTHNFANGEYQTTSYDKHVIRLSYNGVEHKPERLSYDVTINIIE